MKPEQYRLYAKWPGQKRFSPIDYSTGKQVVNLIHASMFTEEEKKVVEKDLKHPDNSTMLFKWQKI